MANGHGHKIITRAALESLPQWMQTLIAPVKAGLEDDYCMYGDSYFIDQEAVGPFIELPDGRLPMDPWEIRYFRKDGPGDDYYTCGYYDLMRYSFEYFAEKCIDCIKANDIESFAKFTGSIAHIIEDCGTPAHAVGTTIGTDMKMIKLLLPPPDQKKSAAQLHTVLENTINSFSLEYKPVLLGFTPAEISFNLLERFTDMLEYAISFVHPILTAFYSDDHVAIAGLLTECVEYSAKVLADFIYSVMLAGTEKPELDQGLENAVLSEYTPLERSAWMPFPYQYAEIRKSPWSLDKKYEPVPLALLIDGREKTFSHGIGAGPPFQAIYQLPENVYRQFRSTVGINCRLGTEAGIVFEVIGDGSLLTRTVCNDVNDAQVLQCDISEVRTLIIKITAAGSVAWPSNTHAVWGIPELIK
jgi:hypothetical protein